MNSERGYHSDGDYDSTVRRPHQHCTNKHYPWVKYYDPCNHFQSQYKRLNPVTPHHDRDSVSLLMHFFYLISAHYLMFFQLSHNSSKLKNQGSQLRNIDVSGIISIFD